jgi:hypothetical protein
MTSETPTMSNPSGTAKKATKATKKAEATAPAKKAQGPRTDPALITKTNKVGFPIGSATPDALRERVGSPVKGHRGYYIRYPYASYDLAAKVGNGSGPAWMAVCRHGNVATTDCLMGPDGVEKVAAARTTWCPECGAAKKAHAAKPAPTKGSGKP